VFSGDWGSLLMSLHQYIVWIDETEARILQVVARLNHALAIHAPVVPGELAHAADDAPNNSDRYFHQIARALDTADEILIVGPSATKDEFTKFMHKNEHTIDPRILGVESINDPTDGELAAFAKLYFNPGGPQRRGNGSGDV